MPALARAAIFLVALAIPPAPADRETPKAYTLTPPEFRKAKAFARSEFEVYFGSEALDLLALAALVRFGAARRLRIWAGSIAPRRFLQAWLVVPPILFTVAIAELPLDAYAETVSRLYGQSIEGWAPWFADWAKGQALAIVVGTLALWGVYALMRRTPSRWWLYAWLASLPLQVAAVAAMPLVVEPLFFHFDPLAQRHPRLAADIERLLHRAGVAIPPGRLLEMRASDKTNSLNAYVSGFGPSKRVVLYDTIVAKENGPPLLTTVGHELGHYVLHHIRDGLLFGFALSLLVIWAVAFTLRRLYPRDEADWDSLPSLLLIASLAAFFLSPPINAFSRRQEREADVYSIEITHGIVAHSGEAAAQAFQIEGASSFADPSPNPLAVFWLYSHPPIAERLRFSLDYDPWKRGAAPRYVSRP